MLERRSRTIWAIIVLAIVATLTWLLRPRTPATLTISTATQGGTYLLLGQQLARVLQDRRHSSIGEVRVTTSSGARENIERLLTGEADLAFAMRPSFAGYDESQRSGLRVLARLYQDVVQVLVHDVGDDDEALGWPAAEVLRGKRIFLGPPGSGTRRVAARVLDALGLSEERGDFSSVDVDSFQSAAEGLEKETIDAAFFVSGKPTTAVQNALASGTCRLLDLSDVDLGGRDFSRASIPAFFYENQPYTIETWGADVFLLAREDLDEEVAFTVLRTLFDNLKELLHAHTTAQDIRLDEAFDEARLPRWVSLHPGSRAFTRWVDETLVIACCCGVHIQ